MADGSVTIKVNAETKKAQAELAKLERDLAKAGKAMEKTTSDRNILAEQLETAKQKAEETRAAIAAINEERRKNQEYMKSAAPGQLSSDDWEKYRSTQDKLRVQRDVLVKDLATQEKEAAKLEAHEEKISRKLEQQTAEYEKQKEAVGELRARFMQAGNQSVEKVRAGVENTANSLKGGMKWLLKWGIGIRSVFALVKRLKSAIKEGFADLYKRDPEVKANVDNLKASLNALKLAWANAFLPIYNLVSPLLQKFVDWMTEAGNTISKFVALMTGKNTYKKAVRNMNSVKDSAEETGEAIEEAKNQLMGFDEINKLNDSSGSKSGGESSKAESTLGDITEAIADIEDGSFVSNLALAAKDVLFDWSDLTEEQVVEKAIAGLTTLGGAILGGMIGGVPGVIIGAAAGLAFGILLDACTFNHDGKIDSEEIAKIVNMALLSVTGGVIGFTLGGGPVGAAIGIAAGLLFSIKLNKSIFNNDGKLDKEEIFNWLKRILIIGGGGLVIGLVGSPALAAIAVGLGLAISILDITIGWDKVKAKIDEFFGRIKEYFNGYIEQWKKHGGTSAADISFYCVMGIIQGLCDAIYKVNHAIKVYVVDPIIKYVKDLFGISSPSKVFAEIGENLVQGLWNGVKNKWDQFTSWMRGKLDSFKQWWRGFNIQPFKLKLPHLTISWRAAGGTISKLLGISKIPSFSVQWYAKGGIVDGATLFGAGEAGKEAIVPLERNTGWIKKVANELFDIMSDRFDGALVGMPAMAGGFTVPPRSVQETSGIYDAIQGIRSALDGMSGPGGDSVINFTATFNANGKAFYQATWNDLKAVEREHGKSLIVNG